MELNKRQLDIVHRLRTTYTDDNGHAHDALIYYLLSDGGKHVSDMGKKIKKAMAFYKSAKGERLYHQIIDHLSSSDQEQVQDQVQEQVQDQGQVQVQVQGQDQDQDDIYDFSQEMAKAAKNKKGHLMLDPGSPALPEEIALQALSNFSKTIW